MIVMKLFYVLLIIGSFVFYILYVDNLSFYLFAVLLTIPFVLLLMLLWLRRKVKVSLEAVNETGAQSDTLPVTIRISNTSGLPISNMRMYLVYKNEFEDSERAIKINTPIFSSNEQVLCLKLRSEHSGRISVKIKKIRIFDMMRLFSLRLRNKSNDNMWSTYIRVLPVIYPIDTQIALSSTSSFESNKYSKHNKGDDNSEIFEIREYNLGDRINRIHWKVTAKEGELFVKEFSQPLNNNIAILIDSFKSNFSNKSFLRNNDITLSIACSISAQLCEIETPHMMIYSNSVSDCNCFFEISDIDDFTAFTNSELFSVVCNEPHSVINKYIRDSSVVCKPFAHIIIITNSYTPQLHLKILNSEISQRVTVLVIDEIELPVMTDSDRINVIRINQPSIAEILGEISY